MDDFARLAKEQQQLELENLVRSRNDITIHVDATRVFEPYQPPPISPFGRTSTKKQRTPTIIDSLERADISQLYMKNSFLVWC
jgi:DnaJ family protein C protein 11